METNKNDFEIREKSVAVARDHFPDWQNRLEELEKILKADNCLVMLFIDASGMSKIESYYGKIVYDEVLTQLKDILIGLRGKQIRSEDILASNFKKGNLFFIFLSQKRDKKNFLIKDFEQISQRLHEHINAAITKATNTLLRERLQIQVGYSIGVRNPLVGTVHLISRMIDEAKQVAQFMEFRNYIQGKEELQQLILREELRTVFQPIVDLSNMGILGYEALSRGPAGTRFVNPMILFGIAEQTGLMFELDRLCRKTAFKHAKGLDEEKKLFVNLLPVTIRDPEFKDGEILRTLRRIGLSPYNIVFEVSEQQAIENFPLFKNESKRYSDLGFSIAIDDAGTGYSNFKTLVEIKLQYIKLDISLIKGVHLNPIKQQIVRSMVNIGRSIQAAIIAEGIETTDEMKCVIDLGVDFAQGYLFARPDFPFPDIQIPELDK